VVTESFKLLIVAAARPNFMKVAPLIRAMDQHGLRYVLVHTGQHYDDEMSGIFFRDLGLPAPDYNLGVGSGSHAEQTAHTMLAFEPVCSRENPDAIVVVGDVNATLACALVGRKLNIPIAHVEAGLRSGDMSMPEEVNRIVTDAISDWLFATEEAALVNLSSEGRSSRAYLVGHTMIDNLLQQVVALDMVDRNKLVSEGIVKRLRRYAIVTVHRPSNVDSPEALRELMAILQAVRELLSVVFVMHPRTARNIARLQVELPVAIETVNPMGYREFLNLWRSACVVLTDSGGLQEETTALGVPCLTLRDTTERPVTVSQGTNTVVGRDKARIVAEVQAILAGSGKSARGPKIWDGKASERIVNLLRDQLGQIGVQPRAL
jgi:UDP-N-acetylglucosamine 2-epimerase (non-hydrolysing)